MRKVAENFAETYAAQSYDPRRGLDGAFDDGLLGRIGDDLRGLYGELTMAEAPHDLQALAEAVDARIAAFAANE